jgi:hypothetical protein
MTFETEMDRFFARNCYSETERRRVRAWRPYQTAADKKDVVEAQEIATRVIENNLGLPEGVSPSLPRRPDGGRSAAAQ